MINVILMASAVCAEYPLDTIFPQTVYHTQQKTQSGSPLPFLAWLPPAYVWASEQNLMPVVIFLNGRGEIGDGSESALLSKCASWGPMQFIKQNNSAGDWFRNNPAIHIAPQINGYSWSASWRGKEANLDGLIAYILEEFHGDPERVYLVGLSMGGGGALFYNKDYNRAAAIVAMGAGANPQYESYPTSYSNFANQIVYITYSAHDTYDSPIWMTGWPNAAANHQAGNEGWLGGMAAASGCTTNCRPLDTHPDSVSVSGSNYAEKPVLQGVSREYTGYYTADGGWQWVPGFTPQSAFWQITLFNASYSGYSDQHWVGWLNTIGTYSPNTDFWSWLFRQRKGVPSA